MIKHNEYGTAHEEHLSFNCAYCQDEIIEKLTAERERLRLAVLSWLGVCRDKIPSKMVTALQDIVDPQPDSSRSEK